MTKKGKEGQPSYESLLQLAGATAQRYGFASGLRKARGDLLRARRLYGLDEIKGLKAKKENIFATAADIAEARKQIKTVNTKIVDILTRMRENTTKEQSRVSEFLNTVKFYDQQVIDHLDSIGMRIEYSEIPVEIMENVKERRKESKGKKGEKK